MTFSKLHQLVLRLSNGRLMKSIAGYDMLLLESTGRTSGRKRLTPLLFVGNRNTSFLCMASFGGSDTHPDWFLNIHADPTAKILVKSSWINVKANILCGQDRNDAWNKLSIYYPSFDKYQGKTERIIPVVQFEPEILPV